MVLVDEFEGDDQVEVLLGGLVGFVEELCGEEL